MTPQEAVDHFGSVAKLSEKLSVSVQAVYGWLKLGKMPEGRQFELQVMTSGSLLADRKSVA